METTETLIVGAGPIGIEIAAGLKCRNSSYRHVEAGSIGSTIGWYAPGTTFFSSPERLEVAGVPFEIPDQRKGNREEYLRYLRSVVRQFQLEIETYRRVVEIERDQHHGFTVRTVASSHGVGGLRGVETSRHDGECVYRCRNLVLAIGDMHRPRLLGVPGETLPHVSHYLGDPHDYFGTRVLIVGGKNSAAEAAIRLHRVGARVTLSYRGGALDPERIKHWILPELKHFIASGAISFLPTSTIAEIGGRSVRFGDGREVPADFVLLLTGYEQDPGLYEQAGIELDGPGKKPRYDPRTMETNVPNLFVAGTGSAGTQLGGVKEFIETSHVHAHRIVAKITGSELPVEAPLRSVWDRES